MKTVNGKSPNQKIDDLIIALLKQSEGNEIPPDTKVKILNTAINWEKVKHHIDEDGDTFDPDLL